MEAPHMLAAISRAKTLARDSNIQISDDVIGYLCKCADVSGSWWDMLGMPTAVSPAHAAGKAAQPTTSAAWKSARSYTAEESHTSLRKSGFRHTPTAAHATALGLAL